MMMALGVDSTVLKVKPTASILPVTLNPGIIPN